MTKISVKFIWSHQSV